MSKITKQNLRHIKCIFEEQTGIDLNPAHRRSPAVSRRKLAALGAMALCIFTMLAFSQKLFTPLDGDKLVLSATYQGDGILSVYVENASDKKLAFQEKTKLFRWVTGEEVASTGGRVRFENTLFPPHSSGTMTIDLSEAYDTQTLENAVTNAESYYLLLTNRDFLFGHDWICSFRFSAAEKTPSETRPHSAFPAPGPVEAEPELSFYFEHTYTDAPLALNENHFLYQQRVEELLQRVDGTVVSSLSPSIMVSGPSEYLDPEPMVRDIPQDIVLDTSIPEDQQFRLVSWEWSYTDGYGRLVATAAEKALVHTVFLPQHEAQKHTSDGGVTVPLIFHMVYDATQASNPDNLAFIYGKLYTFEALESRKVLSDAHYAIYDVTDLIYTDVDAYLEFYLTTRTDIFCDEDLRQRVRNAYFFFRDKENTAGLYYYWES